MSSHLHAELIRARELEIAEGCARADHVRELRVASERPRRLGFAVRRQAVAVAVGVALASASVAYGAGNDGGHKYVSRATVVPVRAHHLSISGRQFELRIHKLEAEGYVQASCLVDGMLMINPHTHRKQVVLA